MRRTARFFKCVSCSTLVEALNPQCCDELSCCGHGMEMLIPNRFGDQEEKHMPVIRREGGIITVCIGRVLHPMSREHRIMWVELQGGGCVRRVSLRPGEDPIVSFRINENDGGFMVYAYCNRHGLWQSGI